MKITYFTSLFSSLFVVGLMISCSKNDPQPNSPGKPLRLQAEVVDKTSAFAFDFFKTLHTTQPAADNVFVSPLSLHIALGMLVNGAEGQTADEIKKTLGVQSLSQTELNDLYAYLLEALPEVDRSVTISLANSVWHRNSFQVEQSFLDVLRKSFKAQVTAEDFNNPATVSKINQWASDNTNGKITKVIERIEPDMVLFLLNALYFKGDWKYQFDPKNTSESLFTLENGHTKTVKMMSLKETIHVADTDLYTAIRLPYGNGNIDLTLLMPAEGKNIDELVKSLGPQQWDQLQNSQLSEQNVRFGLPRFTLNYEVFLNQTLQKMGMVRAFSSAAELGKINPTARLQVGFVKQNTFLGVDEKGTEAAAVTTIGVELTSVQPTYFFDRPFLFVVREKSTNTVLFMGRIMNPESK